MMVNFDNHAVPFNPADDHDIELPAPGEVVSEQTLWQ